MEVSMIHPKTFIQILDVSRDGSDTIPMEKLFRYYYHLSKLQEDGTRLISLIQPIHVTEQFNWTRIIEILQIKGNYHWKKMHVENTEIYLNERSLIPVYQVDDAYTGFHGEVKYPYETKTVLNVQNGDNIRLRRGRNDKNEEIEFGTKIWFDKEENITECAYGIRTSSGFFTGNNIHLIANQK